MSQTLFDFYSHTLLGIVSLIIFQFPTSLLCDVCGALPRTMPFIEAPARRSDGPSKALNFAGKTLVLPAVSFGNVGQLAVDVLVSTSLHGSTQDAAERIGEFQSRHVLPVAGADPYGCTKSRKRLASPCEVFEVPNANIIVMQRRSMCVRGRAREFAKEIAQWCKESGFAGVILLGGADSGSLRDLAMHQGLQQGMLHYVPSSHVAPEILQKISSEYRTWQKYDQAERDANGDVVVPSAKPAFPLNIHMAGISKRLHAACESAGVPLISLLCFVSEGYNLPDGVRVASGLCEHFPMLAPKSGKWVPPSSWKALAPTGPVNSSLFY